MKMHISRNSLWVIYTLQNPKLLESMLPENFDVCPLAVLQWVRANGGPWDEETCANAAWGGHLDVLQWARENGWGGNAAATPL